MKRMKMNQLLMRNPLEIILLVLIIIYLFYPAPTPQYISSALDTPLGVVVLITIVLFLFLYCHVFLGILFIIVAYKLLISSAPGNVAVIEYTPTKNDREASDQDTIILPNVLVDINDTDLRFQHRGYGNQMAVRTSGNKDSNDNLEIAVVGQMAGPKPVNQDYLDSEFKPVAESVHNAIGTIGT